MVAGMLEVHRASRGDLLAAGLGEVLRQPTDEPFVREVVSVPTRGVERWLTQRLSTRLGSRAGRSDGVCANIDFPFPASVVGHALAAGSGVSRDTDPWLPEHAVWPLLAVVDESLDEPWLASLATHLGRAGGGPDGPARRFSAVRHLADLFDRYGVHRPGLLLAWAGGAIPSEGSPAWQARLWRGLRDRIGMPSPAERLAGACERIAGDPALVELPRRLSLFGLTRLPASYLALLEALAVARDVHLWLLHPSSVLWDRVAAGPARAGPRAAGGSLSLPVNPLLRSWGRDVREMQLVLAAAGAIDSDPVADPPSRPGLLGLIQDGIRADTSPDPGWPGADHRPQLPDGDCSIQVHSCHGRSRQVEVLRDVIRHLLDDDPSLEPRDVIVMCPDIEAFAPLIQATFGSQADGSDSDLQVRLADRSLRQTNPVLGTLAQMLDMAAGRVTASELLDLAGTVPVRVRFGFDDDELGRVDGWVRAAGVRWGMNAAWRRPYHMDKLAYGTWAAGLDRILAGVAVSEDTPGLVGDVLPLDDVDSGDIDLAGRAAEFVARAQDALESFAISHSLAGWIEAVDAAARALLGVSPGEEWQEAQLQRIIEELLAQAAASPEGEATQLRPAELRALLADRLRGVPTRANFRTGHLTMCTLVPMRSVPHRVICLLGLDDESFPRRTEPDGDDLLCADPWVGDSDPRSEDRQLLLDAVMAAEETLVIIYSGRDERTNAPMPAAVPVGELLDLVDATVRADRAPARDRITTEHPLQPFDQRNFITGALTARRPWSFDRSALEGAVAGRRSRGARVPAFPPPLPPIDLDLIGLDDLLRFFEHPVRAFLRQRVGLSVSGERVEPGDALPIKLTALEEWQVGERLLRACLAGADLDECVRAEVARGTLPPGQLGLRAVGELRPRIEALARAAAGPGGPPGSAGAIDVAAVAGRTVVAGTLTDIYGDELKTVTYSKLGPRHRLAAWVRVVVLTSAQPEHAWRARTIGRDSTGSSAAVACIEAPGATEADRVEWARSRLAALVDLYACGMREPLPLAPRASQAWAEANGRGRDGQEAAKAAWDGGLFPEAEDQAHLLAFGGRLRWPEYTGAPPGPGETGPGWSEGPSRAGRLAIRLWNPLLAVEVIQ
jgi:exodeoxyribonuclease V gamma subunit